MYTNGIEFLIEPIPKSEANSPLQVANIKLKSGILMATYKSQTKDQMNLVKTFKQTPLGAFEHLPGGNFSDQNMVGFVVRNNSKVKEIRMTIKKGIEDVQINNDEYCIEILLPAWCKDFFERNSEVF